MSITTYACTDAHTFALSYPPEIRLEDIHTYVDTYIHTYIHTYMHTRMCVCVYIYIYICVCVYI